MAGQHEFAIVHKPTTDCEAAKVEGRRRGGPYEGAAGTEAALHKMRTADFDSVTTAQ